jgi:phage minor structural protein
MDFYFTDRKFNVLGVASASGSGPIQIINDIDDQMAPNSVGRSYTGTLITDPTNSAKLADMAALGNFVLYQDPRGKYVFATVMDWPEPGYDPQSGELDFVAENGGIDLINETVGAYKATKAMPIADYIKLFTSDSGFEIGTNEIATLSRTLEWDSTDETALARIESVATQFDNAELDFRFEIDGTAVVKRYIDIYKHIGSDKGQRLEVNTQVNSIKTTGNIYDLFTSIEATGGTPDGKDVPITLKGYKWTDPDGRYVLGADGILRDTVAVQLWSRALSNDNPAPTNHHIQRVKTYDATTQATLVQSALADLKQANHASINYVVDVADLPDQVQVGDTVHLVDEAQDLNLSARLLELKDSYANDTHEATLGDYLIEANQVDPALQEVADQLKTLKQTAHWYPWTRYADDDQGAGISSLPHGKAYMAVVWGKTATPSDDPADYAGKWQKVTGADGSIGKPGPPGADGKSQYIHTAYANSADGVDEFSITNSSGASYMGTCVDENEPDPTDPSRYTWVRFKGDDAITLAVTSVNGNMFKNTGISTVLTVTIASGGNIIDNSSKLAAAMGDGYYLQWQVENIGETEYSDLPRDDPRLLDNGFMLTVNVDDVNQKATYRCLLCDNN